MQLERSVTVSFERKRRDLPHVRKPSVRTSGQKAPILRNAGNIESGDRQTELYVRC